MRAIAILFFLVALLVIIAAIKGNQWLIRLVKPRASGRRLLLYFLIVLVAGLLLTTAFSHLMLSLFFHRKY